MGADFTHASDNENEITLIAAGGLPASGVCEPRAARFACCTNVSTERARVGVKSAFKVVSWEGACARWVHSRLKDV